MFFCIVILVVFLFIFRNYILPGIKANEDIVNPVCNISTAVGTLSAVIVALWLSNRDRKPKLKPYAYISVRAPDMHRYLCLSCVNVSMQPIMCNSLVLSPNKYCGISISPAQKLGITAGISSCLPQMLKYSEQVAQYFLLSFFDDNCIKKEIGKLCKYKWLAKLQLKLFWRVTATTYINQEFQGKLNSSLIEELLSRKFPKDKQSK